VQNALLSNRADMQDGQGTLQNALTALSTVPTSSQPRFKPPIQAKHRITLHLTAGTGLPDLIFSCRSYHHLFHNQCVRTEISTLNTAPIDLIPTRRCFGKCNNHLRSMAHHSLGPCDSGPEKRQVRPNIKLLLRTQLQVPTRCTALSF
jgi:hypothetical protein